MTTPTRTIASQRLVTHVPTSSVSKAPHCTPFTIASKGHIVFAPNSTVYLATNAVFTPECAPSQAFGKADLSPSFGDVKAAFRASVTPQAYATGAATVLSWMLVIMLLITPRTFFVGGVGGGVGLLGRRGMISGSQGGASIIGVGSRPWLQKAAALTVAVSLTIATADTFDVAERQYLNGGFMNAEALRIEVVNSTSIKVSRLISDIFLWLAQVQTLIRLFPRHKEKVLIKWIGFALIVLDTTFSTLNSFAGTPASRAQRFRDAIPALSYLFQLALSMLYACWVLYYAICKRRYAFYHSYMWNVSIVAFLSVIAISTPVVFFIIDIANSSVAGWGDYFRWVGAAAASVIVWEWVERIEALEREEKKDGILGREVFDGEDDDGGDLFYDRRSRQRVWARGRRDNESGPGFTSATDRAQSLIIAQQRLSRTKRNSQAISHKGVGQTASFHEKRGSNDTSSSSSGNPDTSSLSEPTLPPQAASPISRSDTASAASTVYQIHYNSINLAVPPVTRPPAQAHKESEQYPQESSRAATGDYHEKGLEVIDEGHLDVSSSAQEANAQTHSKGRWSGLGNPFKRRKALPPAELRQENIIIDPVSIEPEHRRPQQPAHNYSSWDIKGRFGAFAADTAEKLREGRARQTRDNDLPVTIIPAQARRERPWSPEIISADDKLHASPTAQSQAALLPFHDQASTVPDSPSLVGGSDGGENETLAAQPRSMTISITEPDKRRST